MNSSIQQRIAEIQPFNQEAAEQAKAHIDQLTKPPGSLGRLEELAIQLAGITGEPFPVVTPPGIIVFAGDHGVVDEGVSAFPKEVTVQMIYNFVNGGAAINVFGRQIGAHLQVVDVGVASDLDIPQVWNKKVKKGTNNFYIQDAMTREEAEQSILVGIEACEKMLTDGAKLIIIGEMGIGNTTASSAILSALTGIEAEKLVGKGTGISDQSWNHKIRIVKESLESRKPNPLDPIDVLDKVGGLEIGAMAGAILGAAASRVPVLVDGFISSIAAHLAVRLCPAVKEYLIISHRSVEQGHEAILEELGQTPLLDLQLRLGEGSGAAVAFPIVESSTRMIREMATFSSAGISSSHS
ncbi:nicotinate-nucleotide--dimethylbenzimidazole phosphoribosyltransferase [Brevibacillus ginsengisoli]|uniref:nicotinate-nucleotide--dimethylbenzimidazole phosphoribosyltransferase n=1 Tax=Brevibacillus ginsengisoli TaxID=363854 RepID=UPI003CE7C002